MQTAVVSARRLHAAPLPHGARARTPRCGAAPVLQAAAVHARTARMCAGAGAAALDAAAKLQSRRDLLARTGAGGALMAWWSGAGVLAARAEPEAAVAEAVAPPAVLTRVVGDQWELYVPDGLVREALSPVLEAPSTTVGAAPRALPGFGPAPPANPLKLRMVGSQDGGAQEVVSLGVRRAADLRPTFLQVNDIADFGTLEEVAALLVPPRAKLLASSSAQHVAPSPTAAADEVPLDRTYYTYEFTRGALHGCLVAASKYGKTYVLLASNSSPQFDDAAAARLRAVAASFRVVG